MKERYIMDSNRNIIKDTLLDEEIHYMTNNTGLIGIIKLLNQQEGELKEHNKTQILALILGLLIGLSIGGLVL